MKMSQTEFERQFAAAKRLGDEELRTQPLATGVRFDKRTRRVIVDLNKGMTLSVPVDRLQGVHDAAIKDLSRVEILGPGFHIEWPTLDQQFSIAGLMAGRFGNKAWMTALDRRGAVAKTKLKTKTSRANSKQGRQPRKANAAATI
ncbi:MAG TPA: DUF2442 domain-containing protein [Planctomycetaceae bacterium]|nr:DUF2442 domain-containing protein [Planctomycetaceae bacterium]